MQPTDVKAPTINRSVLMSGADYFDVVPINSYSHDQEAVDREVARVDFKNISAALVAAGISITKVAAPLDCQDGIFTANWGLCRGDSVVLSSLPTQRQSEQPHAEAALRDLGKRTIKPPYRFSGQGDALPAGNFLFSGSNYRTDVRMHKFLADELGYEVISLQAMPELDSRGQEVVNKLTGWPDSFFYDIDLAISVLRPNLIAWYPGAFTAESQDRIRATNIEKIEVERVEALNFACNLISTGSTVVMGNRAPNLKKAIESHGLSVITLDVQELGKGGGYIRCTTLTLDNQ